MAGAKIGRLRGRKPPGVVSSLRFMMLRGKCRLGGIDRATLREIYRVSRPTWPASLPGQPKWWYEESYGPVDGDRAQGGD